MNSTKNRDLRLLPNYFKKIAFGFFLTAVLGFILSATEILVIDKQIIKELTKNLVFVSLLMFALTREKTEDELITKIRLQSFASAFIFGVVLVIINPYINLIFGDSFITDQSIGMLMFNMLMMYFIYFYINKIQYY